MDFNEYLESITKLDPYNFQTLEMFNLKKEEYLYLIQRDSSLNEEDKKFLLERVNAINIFTGPRTNRDSSVIIFNDFIENIQKKLIDTDKFMFYSADIADIKRCYTYAQKFIESFTDVNILGLVANIMRSAVLEPRKKELAYRKVAELRKAGLITEQKYASLIKYLE